ncbi:MAG: DUF4380 domain-containing protein [Tunicatimonas sp.]
MKFLGTALAAGSWWLLIACSPAHEAESSLTWQTQDQRQYSLRWANLSLAVDASGGGRITSLRVADQELLTDTTVHPLYYGSTLWLSPQHRWWPPPPTVDSAPYRVASVANPLTLVSRPDTALGFQVKKYFFAQPADSSLRVTYTLINQADTAQSVALWEVTRLPKDATVTFALDTATRLNKAFRKYPEGAAIGEHHRIRVALSDTAVDKAWYNARGWVRYARGERHLLKRFADLSVAQLPPQQNELEVYIDDSAYVEVEQHSAYRRLAPQDSLVWTVHWYPR